MILVIELTVFTAIAAIIGFIFWYSKFVDANTQNANEIASNSGDDSLSIIMQGIEAVENMLELKEQTDLSDTGPHKRCYNILLLGESGTGKSTMINALANYVRFESFDEAAQANDFTQLIPCKFTLTHPLTGQPLVIEYGGKDSNERTSGPQGHSSTQSPRGYEFLLDDQQNPIRLIDTPGIGDAGGIDLDRRNFDKIFDYLKNGINQLHAVLIQMKSTDITPRVRIIGPKCTAMTLLLQDRVGCAESNGDAFAVLKTFLREELRDVPLTLRPKVNCFFIDNEAFRFLVAQKSGYPFEKNQAAAYRESWNESAQQVASMMSHIVRLPAHDLRQTISLNRARKCILNLAEPMSHLKLEIEQEAIDCIRVYVDELRTQIAQYRLEVDIISDICSRFVCIGIDHLSKVHGLRETIYFYCAPEYILNLAEPTVCLHDNINRNIQLLGQKERRLATLKLSVKDLTRTLHHEVDDLEATPLDSQTTNKEHEIESKQEAVDRIGVYVDELRKLIAQYRSEFVTISDILSRFACVLIEHCSTPYNSYFEPHLRRLNHEARRKCASVPGYLSDGLQTMLETLRSDMDSLRKPIENKTSEPISLSEVEPLHQSLPDLPFRGAQLRQMINAMTDADQYNFVKRTIIDRNKEREIESEIKAIDRIGVYVDELRTLVAEYRSEFDIISDVCSRFAWVLIEHSSTPYNRYFEPYLQLLIDEERRKCASVPGYSRVALDGLQTMLETHRSNVEILRKAIENKSSEPILLSEVETLRESLFNLKHNGAQLRQMMNAMNDSDHRNPDRNQGDDLRRGSTFATMVVVPHSNVDRWQDETHHNHSNGNNTNPLQKTRQWFKNIFHPN